MGLKQVDLIDIRQREDAFNTEQIDKCRAANGIFFTGGDQLRLTSQIGDSPLFEAMVASKRAEPGKRVESRPFSS